MGSAQATAGKEVEECIKYDFCGAVKWINCDSTHSHQKTQKKKCARCKQAEELGEERGGNIDGNWIWKLCVWERADTTKLQKGEITQLDTLSNYFIIYALSYGKQRGHALCNPLWFCVPHDILSFLDISYYHFVVSVKSDGMILCVKSDAALCATMNTEQTKMKNGKRWKKDFSVPIWQMHSEKKLVKSLYCVIESRCSLPAFFHSSFLIKGEGK